MSFLMVLRVAFKALARNKMRTALTMLGMIIGVSAVITMVALGTGAQSSIESQIQSAGTNMIMVSAGNFMQGGVRMGQGAASTLTPEDATAIRQVSGVQYLAAGVNTRGQVVAGNMNWGTRTREIGLRMAIGARSRDVLLQFLVEAVVLSLVGGSIGIALGLGFSKSVTAWMTWPTEVSPESVAVAFLFAAVTGVFFGFYPARKAAALDPIDALRFE